MIEILGLKFTYETLLFFVLFLGSEIIGASKYKSNGVVQLILNIINNLRPLRSEDDKLNKIRDTLGQ